MQFYKIRGGYPSGLVIGLKSLKIPILCTASTKLVPDDDYEILDADTNHSACYYVDVPDDIRKCRGPGPEAGYHLYKNTLIGRSGWRT